MCIGFMSSFEKLDCRGMSQTSEKNSADHDQLVVEHC